MVLSHKTSMSLLQLLSILNNNDISLLCQKHSVTINYEGIQSNADCNIVDFIKEIVETRQSLKNNVVSKTSFNERWKDFEKYLLLDNYKIESIRDGNIETYRLIAITPQIDGMVAFEDELTNQISNLNLSQHTDIKNIIEQSTESFKQDDYNACLSKARIAMEMLVRNIAKDEFNIDDSWGKSLKTLQAKNIITDKAEVIIANTYTFISYAAHIFVNDREYAVFGRNQAMAQCYYIIKRYEQFKQQHPLSFIDSIQEEN